MLAEGGLHPHTRLRRRLPRRVPRFARKVAKSNTSEERCAPDGVVLELPRFVPEPRPLSLPNHGGYLFL